jgi:hypothetical protein
MSYELLHDFSQMRPAERNQVVQTLAPDRPDHPFAVGIGLWCLNGSFENAHAEVARVRSGNVEKIES